MYLVSRAFLFARVVRSVHPMESSPVSGAWGRRPGRSYMQATEKIEGYDSFEQIALGGMATVYKARKVSLDKPVAIKVLFPHLAQDSVYIERFKREAQTAARVQHDNIVNVIDYGESDGSHYIVMEYYDGVTLEQLLEANQSIPPDICCAVLLNVCYGLEAAHAANLVHRDIKPANVIFTRNGGVKIADFGLARALDKMTSVTQHGKIIGTPAYMSPEQTRGDTVGTQSDIFSLGVVAFELACSRRPFEGRNYAEVVDNIQSFIPELVSEINPLIGERFSSVVERMLGKESDDRYAHIAEAVLDLEEAIDEAGFKRDRRTLGRYVTNPEKYLKEFRNSRLKRLRKNEPEAGTGSAKLIAYFRQVLFLDPANERARDMLKRLDGKDPTTERKPPKEATDGASGSGVREKVEYDPDADYKVYLESIDLSSETAPSFALKLSMRIRSPLPRVMSIVNHMPAVVGGRLSIKKAKKLARVIDQLGGIARIEIHPIDESTGSQASAERRRAASRPSGRDTDARESSSFRSPEEEYEFEVVRDEPEPGTPETDPDLNKTVEHHPINERGEHQPAGPRKAAAKRKCPKCGWDEDTEAKFCSVCLFSFNKTEPISLADLQGGRIPDNPLAAVVEQYIPVAGLVDRIRELPTNVKYGSLAALVILLLLIVFGR